MNQAEVFQDQDYLPTDDLVGGLRQQMYQMLTVAQVDEKKIADNLLEALEIGLTVKNIEIWMQNRNLHQPEYQEAQLTKLYEALLQAFNDIKDREGRMIDGVFVKEQDL